MTELSPVEQETVDRFGIFDADRVDESNAGSGRRS